MSHMKTKNRKKAVWIGALILLLCGVAFLPVRADGEGGSKPIVYQGQGQGDRIALTFDDGPHPEYTAEILDILAEYGIHATFFVIGSNVDQYPELLERELSEGHEIGNHTDTHPHLRGINGALLFDEVEKCENAIKSVTGVTPTLFRPPEGVIEDSVKVMAQEKNYSLILWDVDTRDWAGRSSADIVKNVTENVSSGDIILMHDYISKKCHTVEAIDVIIPMLLERGYKFVTVSELIGEK